MKTAVIFLFLGFGLLLLGCGSDDDEPTCVNACSKLYNQCKLGVVVEGNTISQQECITSCEEEEEEDKLKICSCIMKAPCEESAMSLCIGGDKSGRAGDTCTPTDEGAEACQSKICLSVSCPNGNTVNICAGTQCTDSCPTGQECVPISGSGESRCLPTNVCS